MIAKQDEPLHPALIATVLAWGAKFSEHPLLVADRERNGGQSLLAKALINRTRELAESLKVHRIPNTNHVVISLLIEPLQCRTYSILLILHFAHHYATEDPRLDNGNIDLIVIIVAANRKQGSMGSGSLVGYVTCLDYR